MGGRQQFDLEGKISVLSENGLNAIVRVRNSPVKNFNWAVINSSTKGRRYLGKLEEGMEVSMLSEKGGDSFLALEVKLLAP